MSGLICDKRVLARMKGKMYGLETVALRKGQEEGLEGRGLNAEVLFRSNEVE